MADCSEDDNRAADDAGAAEDAAPWRLTVDADAFGARLDKALAAAAPPASGLTRTRLRALMEAGRVCGPSGETLRDPSEKVKRAGVFVVDPPPPEPLDAVAEAIPLDVAYEDAHLAIVFKPAGMPAHPAPGHARGTLVNALLGRWGASLSTGGSAGAARPGIVHRLDKDTSGLLAVARTDAAHQGLSALFAAHDVHRRYLALCWGAPDAADPRLQGRSDVSFELTESGDGRWMRIDAPIGRSRSDRKKMAVASGGRPAVTRARALWTLRAGEKPVASVLECRLETGRTHQIRVHLAHLGFPIVGDPAYGRRRPAPLALPEAAREALATFPRQALHAGALGFEHPITGEPVSARRAPPDDLAALLSALGAPEGVAW